MNRKFVFTLLSTPVLFSSILSLVMMTQPARANQTLNPKDTGSECLKNPHGATPSLVCRRISKATPTSSKKVVEFVAPQAEENQSELAEFKFTEEESEAAVAMFGCDCIACINAIRQMRGLPPAV